ncbi:MAG: exo-alpha-sialidase [Acidimicrobiia bacterium]|nr:exo-alpha-sialidase [Acidimicrobiia bacterium]
MAVTLGIGTIKGAWIARSEDREHWTLTGPHLKGWEVTTFGRAPNADYLASTGSTWYGAAIHRSEDLESWSQYPDPPKHADDRKLARIWTLATNNDTIYGGVAEAGLFTSDDGGANWEGVDGLNQHESQPHWQPGLGGLAAHRILFSRSDPSRIWCAISAVGVFRSDDGGSTWHSRNDGVTKVAPSEDRGDIGFCVHCITNDPKDPNRLWRQDHSGVYRTTDGGDSWERIENGLPAAFGFPITRHHHSGRLFVVPLESDEYRMPVGGRLEVYVSDDDGESWKTSSDGLPVDTYAGPLRDAMDCDQLDAGGVYMGTTAGAVHWTRDGGEQWHTLPHTFPRISSITVLDAN